MKYFLCLLLAVLPAMGQPRVVPIGLFTQFQPQPSPVLLDSVREEVGIVMAPLGIPFEWWSLDDRRDNQAATELAVVTFRGNCTAAQLLTPVIPGPLGFTYISDGQVLPFAEVDCDRIRDFLRHDLLRKSAPERESMLGRAVGRVMAHELFHIFLRSRHHGSTGVSEPNFTQAELLSDRFELASREFRILRASLKPARTQNSKLRAAASPIAGQFIYRESGCAACHGPQGGGTPSAPSLRGALADARAFASRLATDVKKMSQSKTARRTPPALDEDEIADMLSFLNGS